MENKAKISAAILIGYTLVFNVYLYCLTIMPISDSIRRVCCYGIYSIIIIPTIYFVGQGIERGLHSVLICASLFVLLYTFVAVMAVNLHIIPSIYGNLISFNLGIFMAILIIWGGIKKYK